MNEMPEKLIVIRLGLVRLLTSMLVIMLTGVLNRVAAADLLLPVGLVSGLFAIQHLATPVGIITGYLSDRAKPSKFRRTSHALGGLALAVFATPLFPYMMFKLKANPGSFFWMALTGLLLFVFGMGITVSATGINCLLVDLLPAEKRGKALSIVWILTLTGLLLSSIVMSFLIPFFDKNRIQQVFIVFPCMLMGAALWALWGVESRQIVKDDLNKVVKKHQAFWKEIYQSSELIKKTVSDHRWFFIFIAIAHISFYAQEFILEPFGGIVFSLDMASTTGFNIFLSSAMIVGMLIAFRMTHWDAKLPGRLFLIASCVLGVFAFLFLSLASAGPDSGRNIWYLSSAGTTLLAGITILGLSKGMFNVGLSHVTMALVETKNAGIFMGIWNCILGFSTALGEMMGGAIMAGSSIFWDTSYLCYLLVFSLEALGMLFTFFILISTSKIYPIQHR